MVNAPPATGAWQPGQIVKDVQTIRVPPDFPEGPAKLYVGIEYDYWSNKYGIEDSGAFNTDNNVVNFIVKAHYF